MEGEAGGEGELADVRDAAVRHVQRVGRAAAHAGADALERRGELRGARRAHPHAGGGGERGHRALPDDPPAVDDDDVVDGLLDLGEHVAGDEDRAPLAGRAAQEVAQPADALRVQAVGGLVEHEDLRIAEQGRGEPEPLAHAGRVAAGAPVARAAELDEVEHLVHAPARHAREERERPQVVAAGRARA